MKTRSLIRAAALGLILVWLAVLGCGESRSPYAGTYRSVEPFAGQGHIELVLKENGEATWTLAGNTLKFKWRADDQRIWIYTKEGGLLIVTPSEGGKILAADMTGEWHPGCPPDKCVNFWRVEPGG
jgi:outer membrane lipoprotein-sorting protein